MTDVRVFDSLTMPIPIVLPSSTTATRESDVSPREMMIAFSRLRAQNARVVTAFSSRAGISPTEFRALYFVVANPDATPKRVAAHLGLTPGATTSLLDRLEAAGHTVRVANPADRRSLLLQATPQGRDVVHDAGRAYEEAFADSITPAHRRAVFGAFVALGDQLEELGDKLD
ncbi:MAG: MarR family transcriptional regulator [Microbacteriaceae bacterium]